ncbi:MAG: RagB/SusD family nutrient uptake outer membrane protein [Muribaculaceae bacterium]|nr:RagB/SusD family nutrient uptake outer membrane protein [Muribaculaceae bacterium]
MKTTRILSIFTAAVALIGLTGCNDFLDTKQYDAIDLDNGLTDANSINYALNGAYSRLLYYGAAGNYSTLIGDYASDMVYNGGGLGSHLASIYQFTYTDTDQGFNLIWNYGYKVIDNSARIIEACDKVLSKGNLTESELKSIKIYEAEARCLRAFSSLQLVNVFGHQVKVNGQDYSSMPGIVVIESPVEAYAHVERSTVGQTYSQITTDLEKAIALFEEADDRGSIYYFTLKSAYGLMARVQLYLENWPLAAEYAGKALDKAGIKTLTYDATAYKALYNGGLSNTESMFALAISNIDNNGSDSSGHFFANYGYSVSPYLYGLYASTDCRTSVMAFKNNKNWWGMTNPFNGGKFGDFGDATPNPDYATNYLVNAPEMFLIQAEAYANMDQPTQAQEALLVVAKRNSAITSVSDLPATKAAILDFLHEERARELFQEGFRLWDLRRWNLPGNFFAYRAPQVMFRHENINVADLVFPIPANEVNAGFGVEQNEGWEKFKLEL